MRPGFFLREALRSLRRNAVPSFAAIATVLVTMLVLGVFIPIVEATTGAANSVRHQVLLDVYLKSSAGPRAVARVRGELLRTPGVKRVQYLSKAQAFGQQRRLHPAAYQLLGANPLPDTFHVTPTDPARVSAIGDALDPHLLAAGARPIDPAIARVKDRRDDTSRILTVTRLVKLITALLAGLLILASVLLIANTIRLSLFARRREVEVMKLVGATDWFIRWPFVIEGLVVGALGSLAAIGLLALAKFLLIDPLTSDFTLIAAPKTIGFGVLVALIVAAGMALSAVGSGLSLRRFLRV